MSYTLNHTICSISTATGTGAIAVIRVSGNDTFKIVEQLFKNKVHFNDVPANTAKYAEIFDGNQLVDGVIFVKFVAPYSYNGENMVEISCHGSQYIQQKILELLLLHGCRMAEPGEFTLRAFLHGKMDLPQAEAIGDLIESQSENAHKLAIQQLKGGVSKKINELREQFIQLAALLELELDFSEEDVEFADRKKFIELLQTLRVEVKTLIHSFRMGNALKNGIPVAIIGKPNVGKSTLLKGLLNDDRAIVSDIPGTTRDTIEDTLNINGTIFRFIDTAGIRHSEDSIENSGIERTFKAIEKADIILYMVDATNASVQEIEDELNKIRHTVDIAEKEIIIIINKIDALPSKNIEYQLNNDIKTIQISAKKRLNLQQINTLLTNYVKSKKITEDTLLTNIRHYDLMLRIAEDIDHVEQDLANGLPTDLVAINLRGILEKLGQLTGTISDNDILNTIFGKFCIGK